MAPSHLFDDSEEIENISPEEIPTAVAGAQGQNPLGIVVPQQEKEEWCWAAVCAGLHTFYDHEPIEQCKIAKEILHVDCCANKKACNEPRFLKLVLKDLGYREAIEDIVSFDVIQAQIDKNRPLCCFIEHGKIGHFIVISGYDLHSKQVGVLDPAPAGPHDSPRLIPFESFRISYNGGTWKETYLTHPRS
jgi:hypothetical protein